MFNCIECNWKLEAKAETCGYVAWQFLYAVWLVIVLRLRGGLESAVTPFYFLENWLK